MILDRKKIPEAEPDKLFSFPKYETIKLNDKSHLIYSFNNKLPIVQIVITVNAGKKFVKPEKSGLSQLTSMMLDEGAGPYNALELNNKIDKLGINFLIYSSEDFITISVLTLNDHLEEVFQIINYVLNEPHFNEVDFQREKSKLLTAISQRKDNPDVLADLGFYHSAFSVNHPYRLSKSGYTETVNNISLNDIKSFYNNHFTNNDLNFSVCGNINKEYIVNKIHLLLNNSKKDNNSHNLLINFEQFNSSIYLINKPEASQSEIRIGHQDMVVGEKEIYSKQIANMILGGQYTSRLNLNLREKRGFTYGVSSTFTNFQQLGVFLVYTSVSSENTVETVSEILTEMKSIREFISEEELVFVKSSSIKRLPLSFETNSQIISNYLSKYLLNLPENYYDNFVNKISDTSINEVLISAKNYIKPENAMIVICGDSKKYSEELKKLNLKINEIEIDELI